MKFMHRTPLRLALAAALLAALTAGLSGCSKEPEGKTTQTAAAEAAAAPIAPAEAYDILAREGRGFTVGSMMAANAVYVLFDPQCPHCGHLWQASVPLHKRAKFVWMPVSFINAKSAPQGAALLAAADPVAAMTAHEASILAGTGGTSASADIPADVAAAIKKNTELLNRMGVESVPHIVSKNPANGQVISKTGALDTATLSAFLGLN